MKRLDKGLESVTSSAQSALALAQDDDPVSLNETVANPLAPHSETETATASQDRNDMDDLVIHLSSTSSALNDHPLMNIDLNLGSHPTPHATQVAQAPQDQEWLHRLELHQQELKKTLEKHSLLLDFISLASQQQNHQQTQPDPNEALLHNLIEQQTQFVVQLAELQTHLHTQNASASTGRIPEEFKLLLEKQKIEIQKSFSQNVAQNTENTVSAQQAEWAKVQEMLKANTVAAEGIKDHLAPMIQSLNDLKTKVQAVVKKVEDQASTKPKLGAKEEPAGEGGGFMVFIIGMLCGLTVVLSALAIYNFLSHEKAAPESSAKSHDKAAPDSHTKAKSDH